MNIKESNVFIQWNMMESNDLLNDIEQNTPWNQITFSWYLLYFQGIQWHSVDIEWTSGNQMVSFNETWWNLMIYYMILTETSGNLLICGCHSTKHQWIQWHNDLIAFNETWWNLMTCWMMLNTTLGNQLIY